MAIHKIDGGPGGENNHFPKKFVTLYSADASITAGDWVMIHPTDTTNGLGASVTQAVASASDGLQSELIIGVATETITATGEIVVQVAGKYENANVTTGLTVGMSLTVTNANAGRAVQYISSTHTDTSPCGVALEEAVSNAADVLIINKGYF
tara:strand:- start:68 stop:523 length:456 start_codon:yes stop_codon:yes gene_type:complete